LVFISCSCSEAETKRRLAIRAEDPTAVSDGRWEVYQRQLASAASPTELGAHELVTIDTSAPVEELLAILEVELRRS
jgi:predicted kinase